MLREGDKDTMKEEGKSDGLPPFYWAAFVLSGDWR
jgi:CHAT domain-containing protein